MFRATGPSSIRRAADASEVNRFGRASRQGLSGCHPHPDANQATRRIPFAQLRGLVLALIASDAEARPADDDADEAVREFDTQPTTYRPPCPPPAPPKGPPSRLPTLDTALSELGTDPTT
jgi:hypothetical protein